LRVSVWLIPVAKLEVRVKLLIRRYAWMV